MASFLKRTENLVAFAGCLGPVRGPLALLKIHLGRRPFALQMPSHRAAVHLRPVPSSDGTVFRTVMVQEEYRLPSWFPVPRPRVIVDAGANIGLSTVYFAHRYPEARVVAIEPAGENCALLRKNTLAYPNVEVLQAGLWNRDTGLRIVNPTGHDFSFRVEEVAAGIPDTIPARCLETILSERGWAHIDILKMDIEGAEREVIGGLPPGWLSRVSLLVIELHDRYAPGASSALYRALAPFRISTAQRGESLFIWNHDADPG